MATAPDKPGLADIARQFEVAILAKAPIAGYAKTRLAPMLGDDGAARLQDWLIRKTMKTAVATGFGRIALWCAPDCAHPGFSPYREQSGTRLYAQPAGDLGCRMLATLERDSGCSGTIIVGTDCPALTSDDLLRACRALCDGHDAAVIPAEDGGYVLIGVRRPRVELFSGIDWSTSRVMSQTRSRAIEAGISLFELQTKWDVDEPGDYVRLAAVFPEVRQALNCCVNELSVLGEDSCL
jgi:rSAM/selenodomain-associated transferase 1